VRSWRSATSAAPTVSCSTPVPRTVPAGEPAGSFDWTLASAVRQAAPYLGAGRRPQPGHVRQAIETVRPDAVDVSSGVELTPGRKDPAAVRAFVAAVRGWHELAVA